MNTGVLTLSHFLHLLATTLWVGGILMILAVTLPSAQATLTPAAMTGKLMGEISMRFSWLANISIATLAGTGIAIYWVDDKFTTVMDLNNSWNIVILFKIICFSLMMVIHLYRNLVLNRKIINSSTIGNEQETAKLKGLSLNLVRTNCALGLVILLLAAIAISL